MGPLTKSFAEKNKNQSTPTEREVVSGLNALCLPRTPSGRGNKSLPGLHFLLDNNYIMLDNKYMAKMGRPTKPVSERRRRQIAIRLTDAEYQKIEQAAVKESIRRKAGLTVSDYIRLKLGLRGEQ